MRNKFNTKIAVDALAISRKSAGSFTVLLGLMRELVGLCDYKFVIYARTKDIEAEMGGFDGRITYVYSPVWTSNFVLRCMWQQLVLPRSAKNVGCDILYSASGFPEPFTSLPVVSHQQNLWSFAEPDVWWPYKARLKTFLRRILAKIALKTSRANVFISDYLRECANRTVPSTEVKNFTVHNAVPYDLSVIVVSPENVAIKGDFCISVGSAAIHKNFTTLLKAFKIVAEKCDNLNLLIAGNHKTAYGETVQNLCRELDLQQRVVFCGPLDFKNIMWLYKKAMFSVNVSLLEGFGLPVLESMASGCPVICSDCMAFSEIGGTAVCYCQPTDPCDIAGKILKMYGNEDLRKRLSELGLERSRKFNWRNSAKVLMEIFEKVSKNEAATAP